MKVRFHFATRIACIITLLSNSSIVFADYEPLHQKVASAPAFDPNDLNRIGLQAAQEVDDNFSNISPETLKELALNYFEKADPNNEDLIPAFRKETILDRTHSLLSERYPGKILQNSKWAWNNVGGIFGRIRVLYCSFSEYIALFGTDLQQEGFSGEYPYMDVYDIMITGKMVSEDAHPRGALPITYKPDPGGRYSVMKKGESRFYNMDKFSYMIDYGRGEIAAGLWQGIIAPFLFSSHDYQSTKTQLGDCGLSIYRVLKSRL